LLLFSAIVAIGLSALSRLPTFGIAVLIGYATATSASTFLMFILYSYFGDICVDEVIGRSIACGCVGMVAAFFFQKLTSPKV
jgi:hypothetical protein